MIRAFRFFIGRLTKKEVEQDGNACRPVRDVSGLIPEDRQNQLIREVTRRVANTFLSTEDAENTKGVLGVLDFLCAAALPEVVDQLLMAPQ